jgi:hypothetical protein
VTVAKLKAVGAKMAEVVGEEYPGAVIWSLYTRFRLQEGMIGGGAVLGSAQAAILAGLLERAKEKRIPLTLIDGSEDEIGYLNASLDDLKRKLIGQQSGNAEWLRRYPQLVLGATIAPWLDLEHRAYWMTDQPAVGTIEEFAPFMTVLLQQRPFVWVYGAGKAYNVWEQPYVERFDAVMRQALRVAQTTPAPPLRPVARYAVGEGAPPRHVVDRLGDVLADLSKPVSETGIRLAEMNAPDGVRKVRLRRFRRTLDGAQYVANFSVSAWPGGQEWQWPGMSLPLCKYTDWRHYRALAFEVYNPNDRNAEIGVSMVDGNKGEWYHYYVVAPRQGGVIYIPLAAVQDKMDIAAVKAVSIIMRRPPVNTTFHLSNVVLVR